MKSAVQNGAPAANRYPLPVANTTGEQIPPHGVMQVVSSSLVGGDTIYSVGKPTGVANAKYLLNSPTAVPAQSYGAATDFYPADAAYFTGATPVLNAEWGPVNGSWLLNVNGKGFLVLGGAAGGIVRVAAKAGTSAGDDFPLVKIVNTFGVGLFAGTIVAYGPPVNPPPAALDRVPTFQSAVPAVNQPFAVLLNGVEAGDVVDAAPVGIVHCVINYTNANHTKADCRNFDEQKLHSDFVGPATIIWRELGHIQGAGTLGEQWARVKLDWTAYDDMRGVAYGNIPAATGGSEDSPITPGIGLAKLYIKPVSGAVGAQWSIYSSPVDVENWTASAITGGEKVLLRPSRRADNGSMIYTAIPEGGGEGASGTYVGTLSSQISAAGSITTPASTTGTVYSIAENGVTTSVGTRSIYSWAPYPYSASGRYMLKKIHSASPGSEHFAIVGVIWPGYVSGNIQSLGHNANAPLEIQDDTTC